jgi:serpin B
MPSEPKTVRLDRPFVYAIIDNATNLPIFIGTVMTLS